MYAGCRGGLFAQLGVGVPAGVEEHQDGPHARAGANAQEGVDAVFESRGILLPQQVVQEYPQRVHAESGGQYQFVFDGSGVEGFRLPHFQLVDGIGGDVVDAHEPGLVMVPGIGAGRRELGAPGFPCSRIGVPGNIGGYDVRPGRFVLPGSYGRKTVHGGLAVAITGSQGSGGEAGPVWAVGEMLRFEAKEGAVPIGWAAFAVFLPSRKLPP